MDRDPAQVLLRWCLQKGFVSESFTSPSFSPNFRYIALVKSATPSRIHSNAKLYDFALMDEDMEKLDALDMAEAGAISWNPVNAA